MFFKGQFLIYKNPQISYSIDLSGHKIHRNRYILLEITTRPTHSVLRTLSEFAWAKTCVNALGFSIFYTNRKRNVNINKGHVNLLCD